MRKKHILQLPFLTVCVAAVIFSIYKVEASIPDIIYTPPGEAAGVEQILDYPFLHLVESVSASQNGARTIDCYWGNRFLIKQIEVRQAKETWVQASGAPVGVYMETKGVLVIDTQEIETMQGSLCPVEHVIQAGDYLQCMNGKKLKNKEELMSFLAENKGDKVNFTILRDGELQDVSVQAVMGEDGNYKLGLWVRDNSQGIGTLTFTTAEGKFAALGHGISDIDTGGLLNLKGGKLYTARIMGVEKGTSGKPGELCGVIYYDTDNELGTIEQNEICGIFGRWNKSSNTGILASRQLEVGFKQDMQEGPATILCSIENQVQEYDVTIEKIYWNAKDTNKCFILRVTDLRLLEKTGGIVQGMSGSPVIQNGKLVGAVTHVFVQDATSGYGVFAEKMLG